MVKMVKKKIMIGILKDSVSKVNSYDLPSKSYGEALSPIVPEQVCVWREVVITKL